MEGLGVEEIADRLGVDVQTVRQAREDALRRGLDAGLGESLGNQRGPRAPVPDTLTTRDGVVVELLAVAAGENAVDRWTELAEVATATGRWPVILGDRRRPGYDELARFMEDASNTWAAPAKAFLAVAASLDVDDVLRRRWEDTLPIDEDADDPTALEVFEESPPAFAVPPIPRRLAPAREGTIALFPSRRGDEVPAILGWGNWNACPPPEEHAAILGHWGRRYGARLQAMSPDAIELIVSEPPVTFADALTLAREQYAYASDIVDQGDHPTIGSLAAALVGSRHWHFWWD